MAECKFDSNAQVAGSLTKRRWTSRLAAGSLMSKIARFAASRTCFVSSMIRQNGNLWLRQNWN